MRKCFIQNCCLVNYNTPKVSKTDKSDPKRLRKDLPKLVKNIAPEDQMILIGEYCILHIAPEYCILNIAPEDQMILIVESSLINFHNFGLTSLTIISTLLVNFGLMGITN